MNDLILLLTCLASVCVYSLFECLCTDICILYNVNF